MICQPARCKRSTVVVYALVRNFLVEEDGPTAVEYAIMLALMIATAATAISSLGSSTSGLWERDVTKINSAMTSGS